MNHPERFGVATMTGDGHVQSIEEKPAAPKANHVVTGLYIYPNDVFSFIRTMRPGKRGELEITDVNNHYIKSGTLKAIDVKGYWLDTGTFDSLLGASIVKALEKNPGMFGRISRDALMDAILHM